jgi:hypothetical protein
MKIPRLSNSLELILDDFLDEKVFSYPSMKFEKIEDERSFQI